jgi:hypothetical protein
MVTLILGSTTELRPGRWLSAGRYGCCRLRTGVVGPPRMLPNWIEAVFEGSIDCSIVRHSSLIRQLIEHLLSTYICAPLFCKRYRHLRVEKVKFIITPG